MSLTSIATDLTGGFLWKAGAVAGGVAAVALGGALIVKSFEMASVDKQRATLQMAIDDPKTGYVARIAQSETNVAGLQVAVASRDKAITDLSAADAARLAAMTKAVAAAQALSFGDARKLAIYSATPPAGADQCAQVLDIDGRVRDLLK